MNIELPMHTLVIMVGPSQSGKDTFINNVLLPKVEKDYPLIGCPIISSDDIRRELLDEPLLHKYDNRMLHVSKQAFDLLRYKVELAMQFPLSLRNGLIVVNTTGINNDFRSDMVALASKYNYNAACIVFDYRGGISEYLRYIEEPDSETKRIVADQLTRLRTKAMPNFKSRDYLGGVHKIKEKDFSNIEVSISNYEDYRTSRLDEEKDYLVVGDVHGCLPQLLGLLKKAGIQMDEEAIPAIIDGPIKLVVLGDLVDKGNEILDTISFIHKNRHLIHVVKGNHEDWVVRYLRGDIKIGGKDNYIKNKYFNTASIIEALPPIERQQYSNMLYDIYDESRACFIHPSFVCHHAPAPLKHVGKLDKKSSINQMKLRYARKEDYLSNELYIKAMESDLSFIQEQSIGNSVPILTGHIPMARDKLANQYFLDGGCVEGGELRGALISNGYIKVLRVKGPIIDNPISPPYIFSSKKAGPLVSWYDLDKKDRSRIERMLSNDRPINWLAGTMAPADKEGDDLESLESALNYYKNVGVKHVVMQPKYMGSAVTCVIKKLPKES